MFVKQYLYDISKRKSLSMILISSDISSKSITLYYLLISVFICMFELISKLCDETDGKKMKCTHDTEFLFPFVYKYFTKESIARNQSPVV